MPISPFSPYSMTENSLTSLAHNGVFIGPNNYTEVWCRDELFVLVDVFLMPWRIATSRLIHNGGYIQKLLQLFKSPEIL